MLGSTEKNRQIKIIRMQYEELSTKWGHNVKELVTRFEKRFQEARKNKQDMGVFFTAENEAIKIFEERLRDGADEEEQELEREAEQNSPATGHHVSTIAEYTNYERIHIHENASAEIEHLFGAMVDFSKKLLPVLEEVRKLIRDKAYHSMSYEIETLLQDISLQQEGRLPNVFSVYRAKVVRARSGGEAERARAEPFKAILNIARKVKRLGRWIENHHSKLPAYMHVTYDGEGHSARELAVISDVQHIVRSFGLQDFAE